ncbi:hypothetical protein XENOCAPTIV_002284, partial [Xenoophorus captivus]
LEKEKAEIDRFHNLTEEERRAELRNSGKLVTNKAQKGKYKFLQKYYHRGAFFMLLAQHLKLLVIIYVSCMFYTLGGAVDTSGVVFLMALFKHLLSSQDEEEDVYKRDFSAPTLEDHFNKTILPKVMQVRRFTYATSYSLTMAGIYYPGGYDCFHSHQVKNFGRSGRTKYTHLVDQDTTSFDSAWAQESAQNSKFFKQKAAGVRDVFDRPTVKKRKT